MASLPESALLAVAGCVGGVLLARPALKALLRLAPAEVPRLAEVHLNFDVLLVSIAVSLSLMAIAAILPVVHAWRVNPASALRNDSARGMEGRGAGRLRGGMLIAEVAFTLVLSVTAVLLARQLQAEARMDLGFSADRLITLDAHRTDTMDVPDASPDATPAAKAATLTAQTAAARIALAKLDATLNTVRDTPGVVSAGAMQGAPMGFGAADVRYAIRGRQVFDAGTAQTLPAADIHPVTPDLFTALRVPLLQGRTLGAGDRLFAPSVALINASLARTQFPGQSPLGKQIMCGLDFDRSWWTIVGVVGDIRADSPGTPPTPTIYVPVAQHPFAANDMQLVVRTSVSPANMAESLRRRLGAEDPALAVKVSTMTEDIAATQQLNNFRTVLFGSFAALSLFLAAVGMYGVTAYSVTQRRFEFGLRLAVGSTRAQLLLGVLQSSLRQTLVGLGVGLILSLAATRLLEGALGKLPGFDAGAYGLASAIVLLLASVAAAGPAQRAAQTQPMEVLRYE